MSLILPGAKDIVTANGDIWELGSDVAGNWRVHNIQKADGKPLYESYADTERRNSSLTLVELSKIAASYRRLINLFATGFKGANDDANGIDTANSSAYSVNSSSGYVAPTTTASARITGGTPTTLAGTAANINDNNTSTSITWIGADLTAAAINSRILAKIDYGSNRTITKIELVGLSQSAGSNTLSGLFYSTDGTTWTQLGANLSSSSTVQTQDRTGNVTARYIAYILAATTYVGVTVNVQDLNGYDAGTPNNMTLQTVPQTTTSNVSKAQVGIEFDNQANPSLNVDLTAEVTCNGGANWVPAPLTDVTLNSRGGLRYVESADITCPAGTDFRMRLKTFNSKNIPNSSWTLQARP